MSIEEKRKVILAFNRLVKMKFNGTANEYADRLGISKSTFFRLLEYLRDELRAPITYDADKGRYIYEEEGELVFGFLSHRIVSKEDLKNIQGGSKLYGEGANFLENFCPVSTGRTDSGYTCVKVSCRD